MDQDILNFLQILKKYGFKNDIPNITERNGQFLNILVRMSGSKKVLEVGCANGYSTIWLADAVYQNKGRMISIDFSKPTFESAKENLKKAGLSDVVDFRFGDALEVIPTIRRPQKFDFIFIDGQKRQYWDFWRAFEGRLSNKAIVVFDDVLSFPHKTEDFMKKIKKVSGFDQVVIPIDGEDGVLLLKKE